jgi:membrane-associated phospholipid phosphatase
MIRTGRDLTGFVKATAMNAFKHEPIDTAKKVRLGSAFAGLLALTVMVWHRIGESSFDTWLLNGYYPASGRKAYRVASVLTQVGGPGIVIVLGCSLAAWMWFRHHDLHLALMCILAPGAAGVAETLGKVIVHRTRPGSAWMTGESGLGFPSGHASGFAAFAFIATYVLTRSLPLSKQRLWFVVAALVSVLMAVTRVAVGAHYPTDVIAGLLVGVICADLSVVVAPFFAGLVLTVQQRVSPTN